MSFTSTTLFQNQKTISNFTTNFRLDIRYKHLKSIFEGLFKSKGYELDSNFTEEVWFLNEYYKDKDSNYRHFETIFKIFKNLMRKKKNNKEKSFNLKQFNEENDIDSLCINTNEFITKVCDILINSQMKLEDHYRNLNKIHISDYKNHNLKQCLEKLNKNYYLEEQLEFEKSQHSSFLMISLQKLHNFPKGELSFKLIIKELDSSFSIINHEKLLNSNKRIRLLETNSTVDFSLLNFKNYDISFPEIYLKKINQNELEQFISDGGSVRQRKIMKCQNKLSCNSNEEFKEIQRQRKPTQKSQQTFISQSEKIKEKLNKTKTLNIKPVSTDSKFTHQSLSPNKKQTYLQDEYSLLANTSSTEVVYFPFNFNLLKSSGVNLYSYGIQVEIHGEVYGITEDLFMDILISHFEELTNPNMESITHILNSKIDVNEVFLKKGNIPPNSSIEMKIEINFNKETKRAILSRLDNINKEYELFRMKYENIIRNIVNVFGSIKDRLLLRLKNDEENDEYDLKVLKRDQCCGEKCVIY